MKKISVIFPKTQFDGLSDKIKNLKNLFKNKYEYKFLFVYDEIKPPSFKNIKDVKYLASDSESYNEQIKLGFEYLEGDCAVICDINDENYEEYLVNMIAKWETGIKIVRTKYQNINPTFWQKVGGFFVNLKNKVYNLFLQLFGYSKDSFCANTFQLFDKEVYELIQNIPEKNVYLRNNLSLINYSSTTIVTNKKIINHVDKLTWNWKFTVSIVLYSLLFISLILTLALFNVAKSNNSEYTFVAFMLFFIAGFGIFATYYLLNPILNNKLGFKQNTKKIDNDEYK